MPLNQALESNNAEMTKRLKYTKDILTHMLNNNQNPTMNRQGTTASSQSNPIGPEGGPSLGGTQPLQLN